MRASRIPNSYIILRAVAKVGDGMVIWRQLHPCIYFSYYNLYLIYNIQGFINRQLVVTCLKINIFLLKKISLACYTIERNCRRRRRDRKGREKSWLYIFANVFTLLPVLLLRITTLRIYLNHCIFFQYGVLCTIQRHPREPGTW